MGGGTGTGYSLDEPSGPDNGSNDHDRTQARLAGAFVGELALFGAVGYNFDHVANANESIKHVEWQPYLQDDQPYETKIDNYNEAMKTYQNSLGEAATISELETTLNHIQADTTLTGSTRQAANQAETLASSLKHPVSNESYEATQEYSIESVNTATNNHLDSLRNEARADALAEGTTLGVIGSAAIVAPLFIGGYIGNQVHKCYNS